MRWGDWDRVSVCDGGTVCDGVTGIGCLYAMG